jgi:hypothetical protein
MKWLIIWLSAFVIELGSTFYIRVVSERDAVGMMFFAFIGPFLGLPFAGYMIETKTWTERIKMALVMATGYLIGSIVVILWK